MIKCILALIALIAFSFPAEATSKKQTQVKVTVEQTVELSARRHKRHRHYRARHIDRMPVMARQHERTRHYRSDANGNGVIGRRPAGCPHAYCGCEASRFVFGVIKADLNLAANWIRKFPRTSPAPGMAAARNHHVMVLMSHVGGSNWLVHDGNSGHGLTREHVRSISGYKIVDPRGTKYASR